tara:strand:- start:42 stop:155 length:114 start_codon:yes stop_codon:yes gene_type:complete
VEEYRDQGKVAYVGEILGEIDGEELPDDIRTDIKGRS